MSVLALDYGTKRIGVAVSDATLTLASPLDFLPATPLTTVISSLHTLIREREVTLILVGLPRNMDGSYGDSAQSARNFAAQLQKEISIPIEFCDERLTTVQASRQLHAAGHRSREQRTRVDSAAAAVLLQAYLDARPDSLWDEEL